MTRNALSVVPIVVATCLVAGAAQQPTFKGGVRTVAVYATVTDAGGRLVPNLAQGDFEVQDNGKAQEISVFANDVQPITVVVLLDRSGSMRGKFRLVEEAAEEFVHQMGPNDKARVGSFAERIQIDPRDFTSDHDELIKILRTELQAMGPTPLWNAVNVGITALLHQDGRRVVLVFTDGADRPLNFSGNNSSLKDVMKRAEQEDIMVYAIGLAGDNGPARGWTRGGPGPRGGWGGGGGRGGWGGWGGAGGGGGWGGGGWGGGSRGGQRAPEKPDEGLQKIAADTGGGYFELKSGDELVSTFRRVADELHHQYVLGFTPVSLDGKPHKLEVKAKSAEMRVRARRSYLASSDRNDASK
jgi:VWFA-related protein